MFSRNLNKSKEKKGKSANLSCDKCWLMHIWNVNVLCKKKKTSEREREKCNCTPSSPRLSFSEASKLFFTNSASWCLEGEVLVELLLDPSFFLRWWGPISFILSLLGEIIPICMCANESSSNAENSIRNFQSTIQQQNT